MSNFEVESLLLAGLGLEYDSFITSVTTKVDLISLEDLYGHMPAHELWLKQHQPSVNLNLVDANMASRSEGGKGGRGGCFSHYGGRSSNFGSYKTNRDKGRGGRGLSNALMSKQICQVCNHTGHIAIRCYHIFDESYQNDSPSVIQAFFIGPS